MILTPEQIEQVHIVSPASQTDEDVLDTLAAYAEIVQAVGDIDDMGNDWQRIEDLVIRARKLRRL
jgi:hypothetical protein